MPKYYHYTSKDAAKAIGESELLRSSTADGPDAKFGEGVYFVTWSPKDKEKAKIGYNNWGSVYNLSKKLQERMEYVIEVTFPSDSCPDDVSYGNRNIHIVRGDVDLSDSDLRYRICKFEDF